MNESLKNIALWQKKRAEMYINDDVQNDWLQMQALLDESMPVEAYPVDEAPLDRFVVKLRYILLALLIVAAIIYLLWHKNIAVNNDHHQKHKTTINAAVNTKAGADTIADNPNKDSANRSSASTAGSDRNNKPAGIAPTENSEKNSADKYRERTVNNSRNALLKNKTHKTSGNLSGSSALVHSSPGPDKTHHKNKLTMSAAASRNAGLSNSLKLKGSRKNQRLPGANTNNDALQSTNSPKGQPGNVITNDSTKDKTEGNIPVNLNYPVFKLPASLFTIDKINGKLPGPTKANIAGNLTGRANTGKAMGIKIGDVKISKDVKAKTPSQTQIDYGIMAGFNSNSGLSHIYPGVFVIDHFSDKWAMATGIRGLSQQMLTGNYSHANASKVDSGQRLQINDSRKIYTVTIPLQVQYKVSNNISFTAGPVISIPLKQANGNSILTPAKIKTDTVYYAKLASMLNNTQLAHSLNFGFSGGIILHVKRFSFEATYLRSFTPLKVTSDLGSYTSTINTLQFGVGFRLNKSK